VSKAKRPRAIDTLARMRAAAAGRADEADSGDTARSDAVTQSSRRAVEQQPSGAATPSPSSAATPRSTEPKPRRKPGTMRYTLDLAPEARRKLHVFALDNGVPRHAEVMRTLIDLLDDPVVSDRVLDRLQAGRTAS
jgi:hypothetical protein